MAASTEAKFIALASEFHEWMRLRYPLSALVAPPVDAGWEVDDLSDETQIQTRALAQRLYDALQPLKHDRDLSVGIDIFERGLKTVIQGHEHRAFERDCRSDDILESFTFFEPMDIEDVRSCALRFQAAPRVLNQRADALVRGCANGMAPPKFIVEGVLALLATSIDALGSKTAASAGFMKGLFQATGDAGATESNDLIWRAAQDYLKPALMLYRSRLMHEVLPKARDDDHVGACCTGGGQRYYDFCIWRETSLRLTARQIYDRGLAEVVRYEADIRKLVAEQMATPDPEGPDATRVMETLSEGGRQPSVGEILRAFCPPTLKPVWADVESAITPLVRRLKHLLDPMWGVENVALFVVEQNTDKASAGSAACTMRATGDYYAFAADLNRASWTSTTIHEYIHHLQFHVLKPKNNPSELEQAIANLDCWVDSNAMSEGTAVYGEMLARESVEGRGLLEDFTDRLGSLGDRLYRAVRLVLEPAIHAGCDATLRTRAGATAYQFDHTSDTWANAGLAVDRYIAWPGQSLSYALGEHRIAAAWTDAKAQLGPKFDLAAFNRTLLQLGPVSLVTMTAKMKEWADAAVSGVKA